MQPLQRQSGFSLIELMISAVIGLILLAAVVLIATNTSRTQRDLEQVGALIENGRYTVDLLRKTIPHAGYYGTFYGTAPGSGSPDPCSTDPTAIDDALWLPLQPYDDRTSLPADLSACLPESEHKDGTDIMVLRRASTQTTASLNANELYLQSRPNNHVLDLGSNSGSFNLTEKDGTTAAPIRKFLVEIYYIGPDADGIPTFKRRVLRENGGSLGFVEEPLASGIEHFQVDYGIDTDNDGSPEQYVSAPASGDEENVMTVRVHLLARSIEPFEDYTDEKTYNLGTTTIDSKNDSFRRRAFVTTIDLVNPSIRRE